MSLLLSEVSDGVALLTLNAPDTRNTMTLPMVDEIVAAMDALEADESVNAGNRHRRRKRLLRRG